MLKKMILSLTLVGTMLTTNVSQGLWFSPKPTPSFWATATSVTAYGTKKVFKTIRKTGKNLIAYAPWLMVPLLAILAKKFVDGPIEEIVERLIKKLPNYQLFDFIKEASKSKLKSKINYEEKGIKIVEANESFDKDFATGTVDPKVTAILDNIERKKELEKAINEAKNQKSAIEKAKEDNSLTQDLRNDIEVQITSLENDISTIERKKNDIVNPRCILLFGVPQTGKTHSAHCLAKALGAKKYFELSGTSLRCGLEGASEELVNKIFADASRMSSKDHPCVIIINEIDGGTLGTENSNSNGLSSSIARSIQTAYDREILGAKKNIYIIATTNYVSDNAIPEAVKKRFQEHIEIKVQDIAGRKNLFEKFFKDKCLKFTPEITTKLANKTEGKNNTEIKYLTDQINNKLITKKQGAIADKVTKTKDLLTKIKTNQAQKSALSFLIPNIKYRSKKIFFSIKDFLLKKKDKDALVNIEDNEVDPIIEEIFLAQPVPTKQNTNSNNNNNSSNSVEKIVKTKARTRSNSIHRESELDREKAFSPEEIDAIL